MNEPKPELDTRRPHTALIHVFCLGTEIKNTFGKSSWQLTAAGEGSFSGMRPLKAASVPVHGPVHLLCQHCVDPVGLKRVHQVGRGKQWKVWYEILIPF